MLLCAAFTLHAATEDVILGEVVPSADLAALGTLGSASSSFDVEEFLALTPRKVREMTGERLGVKGTFALKRAQKMVRKQLRAGSSKDEDIPKGLYIVLAIFGLAWIAMGLMDDFEGNNWWINLILSVVCFWLPGLIHALIKMKEYY